MPNNIIDSIQVSGTVYQIQGSGGGNNVIELTQAQYDALVDKDPNTFYIITDAAAVDLANYYTKSETSGATQISTALNAKADTATTYTKTEVDNAITAATSTKQDTLVSGTNIKTINNESILGSGNITIQGGGGGGKAISAGTNISVTTGETADTINCTLPISKGSGSNNSLILGTGNGNTASGQYSIAVGGRNNSSSKYCSLVGGNENKVSNDIETAFGNSNTTSYVSDTFGNSGNTLFSIGNGPNYLYRHNAFEIRQDGSIYIPDLSNGTSYRDRPMIKLQDTVSATAANTTALGGLSLVKLTQAQYDALATKDSNVLYVIVG